MALIQRLNPDKMALIQRLSVTCSVDFLPRILWILLVKLLFQVPLTGRYDGKFFF